MFENIFGQSHCPGCSCFVNEQPEETTDKSGEVPMANESDHRTTPHRHEWTLWEIIKEGNIVKTYNADIWSWGEETQIIGTYLDQRRRCVSCGKFELDTQVSYAIKD